MKDIQQVDNNNYQAVPVRQIMNRDIHEVRPGDDLYRAFKLIFQKNIGRLVVLENGELRGIITRSDIMKGFKLQQLKLEA